MLGFDSDFLGADYDWKIDLPQIPNAPYSLIPYTHFSVYHNLDRKLALFSACNISAKFPGIPRRSFRKDLIHLGANEQLGDGFYKSKTLDHPKESIDPFDFLPEDLKTYIVNPLLIEEATKLKFTPAKNYFDSQAFKWEVEIRDISKHLIEFDKASLANYL